MTRCRKVVLVCSAFAVILSGVAFVISRPRPIGQLSPADLQMITNVIRADTAETIVDIRPRDSVVIVDTGRDGFCLHSYELERTRSGWKVTWKGT
jgi:hypothetical protein